MTAASLCLAAVQSSDLQNFEKNEAQVHTATGHAKLCRYFHRVARLFSSMDSREPTSESLQSLKPCPTLSDGADFGC